MAGTLRENRNSLFRAVTDAWLAAGDSLAIDGGLFPLLYGTLESDGVPNSDPDNKPWARANVQHDGGRSTCISGRRFTVSGMITFQIFRSSYLSIAKTTTQQLAEFVAGALMDYEGNVIIKNPRVIDRLGDNGFERTDVIADFEWYGFRENKTYVIDPTIPPDPGNGGGGTPEPSGPTREFIQATPVLVWTVNHNLGYKPFIETLDQSGAEMIAEVRHVSVNQFVVSFDAPTAGSALYK